MPEPVTDQPPGAHLQAPLPGGMPDPFPVPSRVNRILVCQLRQIGDVLLATAAIELLARRYTRAEIHVFTEKKCRPVLEGNPRIHTLWTVDKKKLPTLLHELAFYRQVTKGGFDLVVDFQQLPRCRWVVAMSRAKVRLSFPPPWYLRPLYTHWAAPAPAYAAAYKAGILSPLGITWNGEPPRLYLTREERDFGREFLSAHGLAGALRRHAEDRPSLRLVNVDVTHRHYTRRWLGKHYAALMDMALEQAPDLRFFLPWGPGEEKEVRSIQASCRHKDKVVVADSLLSLRHMAACMEEAVMQFGNCSAPRHMAVALDVPSLTVLGSTSGGWTFPSPLHAHIQGREFMELPCQPCNQNTCSKDRPCLALLGPDLALPAFMKHLQTATQALRP